MFAPWPIPKYLVNNVGLELLANHSFTFYLFGTRRLPTRYVSKSCYMTVGNSGLFYSCGGVYCTSFSMLQLYYRRKTVPMRIHVEVHDF